METSLQNLGSLQDRNTVLVRQLVALFRAGNRYEVLDPSSGHVLATVEEDVPSIFVKLLKFTNFKTMTPFTVHVLGPDGSRMMTLQRGWTFLVSRVQVLDGRGVLLGTYVRRLLSIGGKLELQSPTTKTLGMLSGNLIGWTFTFTDPAGSELATVSRKWSGLGKELLTSADNYAVHIKDSVRDGTLKVLILAGALVVDMVFKNESHSGNISGLLGD